jgi:hypothetical protein
MSKESQALVNPDGSQSGHLQSLSPAARFRSPFAAPVCQGRRICRGLSLNIFAALSSLPPRRVNSRHMDEGVRPVTARGAGRRALHPARTVLVWYGTTRGRDCGRQPEVLQDLCYHLLRGDQGDDDAAAAARATRTSSRKTRSKSSAPGMRESGRRNGMGWDCGACSSGPAGSQGLGVSAFGTIRLRHADAGANTPWKRTR